MRNIILAIVGLLLVILLIFLIWRIWPRNVPPTPEDDSFTTAYETAVTDTVTSNDSDPDGDTLVFQTTLPQQPTNGTASLDSAGTFVYTPNAGFSGDDQFSYEVCDPDNECATAMVTITVDPPVVVANDDTVETMLNTAVPIGVTANDQGADLTVQNPNPGPANGTAVIQTDPLIILYTPNENYVGGDSFTYEVCNPAAVCDSAQVNVTVRDFQLTNDQFTTPKNLTLAANVRSNDSGNVTVNTTPANGPSNGTLTLQESGEFSYVPNADFIGEDSFDYEACNAASNCATATASIKVGGPILEADNVQTTVNKPVGGNVLANDQGDSLQVNQTPKQAPANGTVVMLVDGRFTYTPNTDFKGNDTFTYETCDSDGLCAEAEVTVSVEDMPTSAMHEVIQGEWLLQIARCYGTSVQAIRAHNYIYHPDRIYPGQMLYIPNIGSTGPYFGPECVDYHKVASGETLESIAATYNISESELARINGLYVYVYYSYDYYYYDDYYGYRYCCGYGGAYPWYGYYYGYYYMKDIYEGQTLILPEPIPDYMRPNS
ncbi:MAG: hypothetical protein CL608_08875 [Anaerolineaceae bacterium]|nr:hypothetical protein [Anaerolineaceae bacterium]